MNWRDGKSFTQVGYTKGKEWNGFRHIQLAGVPKIFQVSGLEIKQKCRLDYVT